MRKMTSHLRYVTSLVVTSQLLLLNLDLTSAQSTADQRFTQAELDDGSSDSRQHDLELDFQQKLNEFRSWVNRELTQNQQLQEQRYNDVISRLRKERQLQQVQQERRYNESIEGIRREFTRTLEQWRKASRQPEPDPESRQHS